MVEKSGGDRGIYAFVGAGKGASEFMVVVYSNGGYIFE